MKRNAPESHQTFALETYVRRSLNYLNEMVDKDGLPYFNIFWTTPAEAAHDWPDFGDVMARQLQAAVMARHATGESSKNEAIWSKKLQALLSPSDGLLYRLPTNYSEPVAAMGDQALTLYALVTAYADRRSDGLRERILRMVDTLHRIVRRREDYAWFPGDSYLPEGWKGGGTRETPAAWDGFIIKSLTVCARVLNEKRALELAGELTRGIFDHSGVFPDNTFGAAGHVHGNLRTLCGAADYAIATADQRVLQRVDALYRFMRSQGTRFGFLPEVVGRKGDIVSCETCALMDYLALAVTLANHGDPEYWGDAERLVRNQLVESQAVDLSWLTCDDKRPDTEQFSWRSINKRLMGGWAGWTSPNHFLAAEETLHWGADNLRNKTRLFQNCCGGSGVHALFIVWKNAARMVDGCLHVNLHVDKSLPEAEIRGYQPYQGLLTIKMKRSCPVRVRVPEFVRPDELQARIGSEKIPLHVSGRFADLGQRRKGEKIQIQYPLPVTKEEVTVGNPGFQQYRYEVTWKGDTVVRMTPIGNDTDSGYSDFEQKRVRTYYGQDGPGLLYQREHLLEPRDVKPVPLHTDRSGLDFW